MKEKRMDFNRDNSSKVNANSDSRNNMDRNLNTNLMETLKKQASSMNFWGEGRFDDELVLSCDY